MNNQRLQQDTVVPIFEIKMEKKPAISPQLGNRDAIMRPNAWMNSREAAEYMRISVGHLRNLVWRKKITANRGTGRLLFRRVDLDKVVESTANRRIQWR